MGVTGHLWTILPEMRHALRSRTPPAERAWSTTLLDPVVGSVRLRGALSEHDGAHTVVIAVHGLGGSPDSHYMTDVARAAHDRGWSCLRMSLRGADRRGEDFYHAGLTDDITAAVASPECSSYTRVFVIGYSLGGHVTLRAALCPSDPRIRAVAAICAPLDLGLGCTAIDAPGRWIYRNWILRGLREIYTAVAERAEVPTPLSVVERITSIREWDRHTVVPRHGFFSVDDYYERMSVGSELDALTIPSLYVGARNDPMVPPWTVSPALERSNGGLDVRWTNRGGHVGFPHGLDLGLGPKRGLEHQVMNWFANV